MIPQKKKKFMSKMNPELKIRKRKRFLCPHLEIVRPIVKVGPEAKIIKVEILIIFESIDVNEKFL